MKRSLFNKYSVYLLAAIIGISCLLSIVYVWRIATHIEEENFAPALVHQSAQPLLGSPAVQPFHSTSLRFTSGSQPSAWMQLEVPIANMPNMRLATQSSASVHSYGGGIGQMMTQQQNHVSQAAMPVIAFTSVSVPPVRQKIHNIVSISSVGTGEVKAAPTRRGAPALPPPPPAPEADKQLGMPIGDAVLPWFLMMLAYGIYRRRRCA